MTALDRNIWRSRISVGTKSRLYNSCILPIFLYVAETWAMTATSAKTFDALHQWCLRRILDIYWTERITDNEVRSRTQQPLLSDAVRSRRLRFFGHIGRADPNQDHSWALYATTQWLKWSVSPDEATLEQTPYPFHTQLIWRYFGRTLSERPCYILPLFFFIFFYARLSWPNG